MSRVGRLRAAGRARRHRKYSQLPRPYNAAPRRVSGHLPAFRRADRAQPPWQKATRGAGGRLVDADTRNSCAGLFSSTGLPGVALLRVASESGILHPETEGGRSTAGSVAVCSVA